MKSPATWSWLGRFSGLREGRAATALSRQRISHPGLFEERTSVLNTPTGSGKSLVATALHFQAIARGRRSIYTCPIKALVNEKFHGPLPRVRTDNVGSAPATRRSIATHPFFAVPRKSSPTSRCAKARRQRAGGGHGRIPLYADRSAVCVAGALLTLPQTRFLLMSRDTGRHDVFSRRTPGSTGGRRLAFRPRTGRCRWSMRIRNCRWPKTLESLAADGKAPVYVVHFTQLEAAQSAQDFTSINVCTREESRAGQCG